MIKHQQQQSCSNGFAITIVISSCSSLLSFDKDKQADILALEYKRRGYPGRDKTVKEIVKEVVREQSRNQEWKIHEHEGKQLLTNGKKSVWLPKPDSGKLACCLEIA